MLTIFNIHIKQLFKAQVSSRPYLSHMTSQYSCTVGFPTGPYVVPFGSPLMFLYGKKFLLRHFFAQVLNRKNPSFIRASLLSKECFISPRFCLLEFKITSNLEKYFCGFIHV
jgi:hypothetical protein